MSDLRDLYQELILDHSHRPRNYTRLLRANRHAEGDNPLCGDHVQVYIHVVDGVIADIGFQGSGCAISTASASMMTAELKGKTEEEAEATFRKFQALITGSGTDVEDAVALGKLAVFSGVREFPIRVKCAGLPWHTLHAALQQAAEPVSTE